MWAAGLWMSIFLLLPEKAADKTGVNVPGEEIQNINGNITSGNAGNEYDAYVFINVGKKHLLTQFVASLPENDSESLTDSLPGKQHPAVVEKVSKRRPVKPSRKSDDFTIKKTPGI